MTWSVPVLAEGGTPEREVEGGWSSLLSEE